MQDMGSRIGSWGRVLSVAGIAALAMVYLGSSAALADLVSAPTITSASEAYFKTGVPTTFTVTTTGNPAPTFADPGTLPAGLTFHDNGDGTATLSGTAQSGQEGDHAITITATNGLTPDASQLFTIEVGVAVCVLTITSPNSTAFVEGEAGSFQATTTNTCSGGTTQFSTIGPLPAGVTLDPSGLLGGIPGLGTAGTWNFMMNATDGDTAAVPQAFTLTVGPPLVVTSDAFSAIEGASFTAQVGHFTGGMGPFAAHIAWGDGSTTDIISGSSVVATHTYAEEGSKNVTLSITDAGTTKSSTLAHAVADANLINCDCTPPAIAANEGTPFLGVVGFFSDNDLGRTASDYTATIAWGDGTTSSGAIVAFGGGFNVTGTHIYTEHGPYSGAIAITDTGGANTGDTFTATIAEVSPLVVTGKNITATAGVSFTGQVATFTDNGGKEATSDYVVKINWGDGTATDNSGIVGDPPGVLTVGGTHTYAAVGTYTITIGAEESDGGLFDIGTGSATVIALPLTSAPSRPQPIGLLLVVAAGLLLVGGGVAVWRRRTVA